MKPLKALKWAVVILGVLVVAAYSPEQRRAFLVASCADAKNGRMPMSAYLRLRPDAKLSPQDVETICGASR